MAEKIVVHRAVPAPSPPIRNLPSTPSPVKPQRNYSDLFLAQICIAVFAAYAVLSGATALGTCFFALPTFAAFEWLPKEIEVPVPE